MRVGARHRGTSCAVSAVRRSAGVLRAVSSSGLTAPSSRREAGFQIRVNHRVGLFRRYDVRNCRYGTRSTVMNRAGSALALPRGARRGRGPASRYHGPGACHHVAAACSRHKPTQHPGSERKPKGPGAGARENARKSGRSLDRLDPVVYSEGKRLATSHGRVALGNAVTTRLHTGIHGKITTSAATGADWLSDPGVSGAGEGGKSWRHQTRERGEGHSGYGTGACDEG